MRAARLLHMLLILQNRGRTTAGALARELEVSRRTILRDLDAMTEAGLPIVVHRGRDGGIELGFDYRTRLTGLDHDEAEAMGVMLSQPLEPLSAFGLAGAGARARAKIWEAFPDVVRHRMAWARAHFAVPPVSVETDPRLPALAQAIRDGVVVRLRMRNPPPEEVAPVSLGCDAEGWHLSVADGRVIPRSLWGDINISRLPAGHAATPR